MAGSVVTAATLKNVIKYQTDKASLKRVRDDMKKLQQDFSKTEGKIAQTKQKADKQAYTAQLKQQKSVDKQQRDIAKQAALDLKAKANEQKKLAAAQSRAAKIQLQQQAKTSKVNENAMLAQRKAHFDLGRLQNLGGAERFQAIKHAQSLVSQYQQGAISLRNMNQQLSQNLATQKSISRNNAKQQKVKGSPKAGHKGSSNFVAGNLSAMLPAGLLSGAAAAYLANVGYQATREALNGAIERQRGRTMVQSMGMSTLEADSLKLEVKKKSGFDLSDEKISDIAKDTQDKIGQLSLGEWKQDKKSGDWSYSGGGEMSDWLKIMTERGGYSREGSLKALRDVKGPGELAVLLKSLQKSAKLTDGEFTALSEVINDFSYITKSVDEGGKNLLDTQEMLVRSGLALTDKEQENIKSLSAMAMTYDKITESGADKFSAAFAESLAKANINADTLSDDMRGMSSLMKGLGAAVGDVTAGLIRAFNWLNRNYTYDDTAKGASDFYGSTYTPTGDSIADMYGSTPRPSAMFTPSAIYADMSQNAIRSPAMTYQPSLPDIKAEVTVNVTPSDEFGNMVQTTADQRIEWAFSDQVFQINQSLLGE